MSVAWVAGDTRARSLLSRRAGRQTVRELARCGDLDEALTHLVTGPYGREVRPGQTLEQAEFGLRATLLWHVRVLVGWQFREGARLLRLLAGWFEVANVCEHAHTLAGHPGKETYRLGSLSVAWPRLAATRTLAELRAELAASPWGDPGAEAPQAIAYGVQLSWAARLASITPEVTEWAAGGVALVVARQRFLGPPGADERALARVTPLLGAAALDATSLADMAARLPNGASWALSGCDSAGDLWSAESRWWARVERDGFDMLRRPGYTEAPAIGAVAVLAADCRRVTAALELAARGGATQEALDALA